jgi:hypothetical protein
MPRTPNIHTEKITFSVTPALKAALEAEAWESGLKLQEYIRGLLERRGKHARSIGQPGHYDIYAPECAKKSDDV